MRMDMDGKASGREGQQDAFRENSRCGWTVTDPEDAPAEALSDGETIDMVAARILERFRPAFEELAK